MGGCEMKFLEERNEQNDLVCVIIPDGIVGNIDDFSNYDPNRIAHYTIKNQQLLLYMTEENRQLALQDFKSMVQAFKEQVDTCEDIEVASYAKFECNDDLTVLDFYMQQADYRSDIFTAIIESTLVIDVLYYQLYAGNIKPCIKVRYFSKDSHTLYETLQFDHT